MLEKNTYFVEIINVLYICAWGIVKIGVTTKTGAKFHFMTVQKLASIHIDEHRL